MLTWFKTALHRFRSEDHGSMTAEAVIILPILIWWYLAIIVFFDAYQARNINLKASFTISDLLSRNTTGEVAVSDLLGVASLFDYLTSGHGENGAIRVSMIYCQQNCDDGNRQLRRDWSHGTNGKSALTNLEINNYEENVPIMPQGERLILVETFMDYEPIFDVGLNDSVYENVVLTRPRFTPTICLTGRTCE